MSSVPFRVSFLFLGLWLPAAPALAEDIQPSACGAQAYHARFAALAGTELAALREAGTQIGDTDPALPGRLIFSSSRPNEDAQARNARRAAEAQARRQGRTSFATNADTRWIASRVREDLTDYLSQKPSPFLCAGVSNYLQTLRAQAARGAPSPAGLREHVEAQREVAANSVETALRALRPAPLPRFRPDDLIARNPAEGLRLSIEAGLRELEAHKTVKVAATGQSQISEGYSDPDLPPLGKEPRHRLQDERDILGTINLLVASAERADHLQRAERGASSDIRHSRRVLTRLARLDARFRQSGFEDPLVRPAMTQAFADLEALDYLHAALDGQGDEMSAALYGTIEAIETAHQETCGCAD